jgi:hypothetical protein
MEEKELMELEFHIESEDYFGTLATVISVSNDANKKISQEIINDLIYLQENYKIVKK